MSDDSPFTLDHMVACAEHAWFLKLIRDLRYPPGPAPELRPVDRIKQVMEMPSIHML